MKDLDSTCGDCPTREIMPDIASLMRCLQKDYPEVSKRIQEDGMSPMFGAVLALRTQAEQLLLVEQELEELKQRQVEGVNCNES